MESALDACRRGGETTGRKRIEAKEFVDDLVASGLFSKNEGMDLLRRLSQMHQRAHKICKGAVDRGLIPAEMSASAGELIEQVMKEKSIAETHEVVEVIEKFVTIVTTTHFSIYRGSIAAGEMRTDAMEFVHDLVASGTFSRDEAIEMLGELSPEHRALYKAA